MMKSRDIQLFLKYTIDNLEKSQFFKIYPEANRDIIKTFLQNLLKEEKKFYIYTDGASRGNPGNAGAGFIIYNENGDIVKKGKKFLGKKTNNEAEYYALIIALKNIPENASVSIFSDSELMVKQLNGEYKVRNEKLKPLYNEVIKLLENKEYNINHIKREKNKLADNLANEAIDDAIY